MKKSLAVFFLLLVCAAALISASAVGIGRAEEQVTITSQTLAGDPAAASGITVTERTTLKNHLLWETCFAADNPAGASTDFSFFSSELQFDSSPEPHIEFMLYLNGGIGSNSDILADANEDSYCGFPLSFARALAAETAPGETKKGSCVLADYYEYLPYNLDYLVGGEYTLVYVEELEQQVKDFFRFKTPRDLVIDLELTKDNAGNTVNIDYSCDSVNSGLQTVCTATEDGFYFTFYPDAPDELSFDEVPGGFGIYHLPWTLDKSDSSDIYLLQGDQLANIYPLDAQSCKVLDLVLLSDKQTLCLFTLEEGVCWLNLISLKTTSLIQRLAVDGNYADGFGIDPWVDEDFILLCDWENSFSLLERGDDGQYTVAFSGNQRLENPVDPERTIFLIGYDSTVAFDGQRLVIITPQDSRGINFWLGVFDQNGLAYAGSYKHSQTVFSNTTYSDSCVPIAQDAFSLEFA